MFFKDVVFKFAIRSVGIFLRMPFYAVRVGKKPGVYTSWDQCLAQVNSFPKARYKKFPAEDMAWDFIHNVENNTSITTMPKKSESSSDVTVSCSDLEQIVSSLHALKDELNTLSGKIDKSKLKSLTGAVDSLTGQVSGFLQPGSSEAGSKRPFSTDGGNKDDEQEEKSKSKKAKSDEDNNGWTGTPFDESEGVKVYTDGGCFFNGKKGACGGMGIYWGPDNPKLEAGDGTKMLIQMVSGMCHATRTGNTSEKLPGKQTNNRAEIHASYIAVKQAKEMGIKKLIIHTDSQFLINSITKWIVGWKKRDWVLSSGGPVVNKDDFVVLDEALQGIDVKWVHVKGHSGVLGNEMADKLAKEGSKKPDPDS